MLQNSLKTLFDEIILLELETSCEKALPILNSDQNRKLI